MPAKKQQKSDKPNQEPAQKTWKNIFDMGSAKEKVHDEPAMGET